MSGKGVKRASPGADEEKNPLGVVELSDDDAQKLQDIQKVMQRAEILLGERQLFVCVLGGVRSHRRVLSFFPILLPLVNPSPPRPYLLSNTSSSGWNCRTSCDRGTHTQIRATPRGAEGDTEVLASRADEQRHIRDIRTAPRRSGGARVLGGSLARAGPGGVAGIHD